MSNLLQKIQEVRVSVQSQLDAIKLAEDLDNLDAVAIERSQLREKLEALDNAENNERQRIDKEASDREKKARDKYFAALTKKVSEASKQHHALTDKANGLILELIKTLIEREQTISRAGVGVDGEHKVIDFERQRELREELAFVHDRIKMDDTRFRKAWWHALYTFEDEREVLRLAVQGVERARCGPLEPVELSGYLGLVKSIADR